MPKIIFTSRYIRNPKSSNAGKLLRYMGTRESVEKVAVGVDRSPSTVIFLKYSLKQKII